jgi:NAD(P)-dependent dehydrogenase (short-subunit alcohol dehydrogenase family)
LTEKIIHEDKLNHNSMILNVSSYYARLGALKSKDMKQKFEKVESLDDLEELKNEFLERFPESLKWYAITWPCQAYSFSKLLLNYYTKLLSESEYIKEKQIQVYAVHPSWVRTDMGGDKAPNDVDYGVKSILAPLSFNTLDKELQGKMLFNGKVEK